MAYQGLVNEGATCYLNSLLQTLYMTRQFRENIYSYVYKFPFSVMIQKKLMRKIAFLFNFKNYLLIYKHQENLATPVTSSEVSNGLKLKHFSSMMYNNFAENYLMLSKHHIKTHFGLKNCSDSSLALISIVENIVVQDLSNILTFLCL